MPGQLSVPFDRLTNRMTALLGALQLEDCSPEPRLPACYCHLRHTQTLEAARDAVLILHQIAIAANFPLCLPDDGSVIVAPLGAVVLLRSDVFAADIAPDEIRVVGADQVRRRRPIGIASGY